MQELTGANNYPAVQFRIARPTARMEAVTEFYTRGLGLQVLYSFEGHNGYQGVMIGLPGLQYHLEFTQDDKHTECNAPTKENLLVLYFDSPEKLNSVRRSLEGLGYEPVTPENPYWEGRSWTYEDPEGWRVVLYDGVFLSSRTSSKPEMKK
jgi:catechol 2,3-dioxygenase-like lactoylglutathione lyase family enzyme